MDPVLRKYVESLTQSATDIFDEIELASEEGVPIEDIEGAKAQAADLLSHYDRLRATLCEADRAEFEAGMGVVVERIKEQLTHLKEAPE
jgi:hypothetical protein